MTDPVSSPAHAVLLDLVWLADHPGDRVVYRHLTMSPLVDVLWPEGVPSAEVLSSDVADELAEMGLAGFFRHVSHLFHTRVGVAVSQEFLRQAEAFERTRPIDRTLGDFFTEEAIAKPLGDNRSARDSRAQCRTRRARGSRALRGFEIASEFLSGTGPESPLLDMIVEKTITERKERT